jgi:hypothetical protein
VNLAALRPASPTARAGWLHLCFLAARIGWAGWLGALAIVLALLALLPGQWWLARTNERATGTVLALQEQLRLAADPRTARRRRDPLADLVSSLPPADALPDFVTALQRRAEAGAVQIDRTEYRVQPALGRAAQRFRLRFPAHVDYPHLRSWLEGLLHDYPNLSIEEISLRRAVDGGEELDASIGLSFLAKEQP